MEGANFPSVKSCNYVNAAGRPRGANNRGASPNLFLSSSAGSEANETVQSARLERSSPSVAEDVTMKRSRGGHCESNNGVNKRQRGATIARRITRPPLFLCKYHRFKAGGKYQKRKLLDKMFLT